MGLHDILRSLAIFAVVTLLSCTARGPGEPYRYPWPLAPQGRPQPVAHHYHTPYRPMTDTGYLHGGIDICAPAGTPVFSVARGHVEIYREGRFDNVILVEASGDVWEYRHLAPDSTDPEVRGAARLGKAVEVGAALGKIGAWGRDYDHLHLNRRNAEGCILNPLASLLPVIDTTPPEIRGVYFVQDGSDAAIVGEGGRGVPTLTGDVDIIVDAMDVIDGARYGNPPIEIRVSWRADAKRHEIRFAPFRERLPLPCVLPAPRRPRGKGLEVYVRTGSFASQNRIPHIKTQRFAMIVTNVDPRGNPDGTGHWDTSVLAPGLYTLGIEAFDDSGNRGHTDVSVRIGARQE